MKQELKNLAKTCLFFVTLLILTELFGYILTPKANIKKFGFFKSNEYDILSEPQKTIDALFVGDSLAYSSIIPIELWDTFGYTSYVCSRSAQTIKHSYDYINVAVSSQYPQIVFLEMNTIFRNQKKQSKETVIRDTAKTLVPIVKNHTNWKKEILLFLHDDPNDYEWESPLKGYRYNLKEEPLKKEYLKKYTDKKRKILKDNLSYFDKIYNLCKENNIELILISTPSRKDWNYEKHNAISELSEKYNLQYIDLNIDNIIDIDWNTDSKDGGEHLNYYGALKVTNYYGQYINKFNKLESHKEDIKYAKWNSEYKTYKKTMMLNNVDEKRKEEIKKVKYK